MMAHEFDNFVKGWAKDRLLTSADVERMTGSEFYRTAWLLAQKNSSHAAISRYLEAAREATAKLFPTRYDA